MPLSATEALAKGAATAAVSGLGLLALLAAPPVASRLARLKLPNSWCLYGPLLFAEPVAAGVVLTTPVAAAYYYNTSRCAERP